MRTDHKSLNRIFAFFVFLASLILYVLTLAPTASFWDPPEFIAVGHWLEVTHPPGAPFFALLGRVFSMFMPSNMVAFSINFLSGLASALTIMLLYLIIVRLIQEWRGNPDTYSLSDKIGLYGGAIIGALTFAVSDSFWFNAVEAEVYATSMFFTAIAVWLVLVWSEHSDEPGNERWLVLLSYMVGLAIGVHLLNLLTIFFVVLIIYFRKYEFKLQTFLMASAIACGIFLLIYPITISKIPSFAGDIDDNTYGLIQPWMVLLGIVLVMIYGVYYTQKKNMRLLNIAFLMYSMILIGYSSYSLVFIRAKAHPPVNENQPETVDSFVSYINRDQYGQTPLLRGYDFNNQTGTIDHSKKVWFPRRYDGQSNHLQKYAQYSSDWDFFWNYQVGHMYVRYFNWNFIGKDSDLQDAPWTAGFSKSNHADNPGHNIYFAIPFLLGVIGLIFHYQKDWKRALSVSVLFLMTGFAIIVFLNQYPFQPRERDYSYVGSFFAYSIWVGLGATGLVSLASYYLKNNKFISYAVVGLCFLAVPFNMLRENYHDHDRHLRYVAPDYAYNLLNSCAPNAIVFTNGDNDTFPLWYLQEVEHVRTDVRVVCLSLLNTNWYIKQLKNQWSHNSPPIDISYTNDQIDHLEDKFNFDKPSDFWTPKTVTVPINKKALKEHFSSPPQPGSEMGGQNVGYVLHNPGMAFDVPVDSLDNQLSWYYQGRYMGKDQSGQKRYYTMIQDDMVMDIIRNNINTRPIYFAITVSYDAQLNLQKYFRLEGQAYRVVPKANPTRSPFVDTAVHGARLRAFRMRNFNNPHAYFDQNIRRMIDNYRELISNEASAFMDKNEPDSAISWLKWGERKIPFDVVNSQYGSQIRYAYKYAQAGDYKDARRVGQSYYDTMIKDLKESMSNLNNLETQIQSLQQKAQMANADANMSEARALQDRAKSLMNTRQSYTRNVYFNSGQLFMLQRIYYLSGDTTKAKAIAEEGDNITDNRVGFPKTEEQNKMMVEQIFGH